MILLGLLVGGAVVVAATVPGVKTTFAGLWKSPTSQIVRYKVTAQKLPVTVVERGNLEMPTTPT